MLFIPLKYLSSNFLEPICMSVSSKGLSATDKISFTSQSLLFTSQRKTRESIQIYQTLKQNKNLYCIQTIECKDFIA